MVKFSRRQIADMFLIFHRKHDSMQRKQDLTFAWNVKSCFLEKKIRKKKQKKTKKNKMLSAEIFIQSAKC